MEWWLYLSLLGMVISFASMVRSGREARKAEEALARTKDLIADAENYPRET